MDTHRAYQQLVEPSPAEEAAAPSDGARHMQSRRSRRGQSEDIRQALGPGPIRRDAAEATPEPQPGTDAEAQPIDPDPLPYAGAFDGGPDWGTVQLMQSGPKVWGAYAYSAGAQVEGRVTAGEVDGDQVRARYAEELPGGRMSSVGELIIVKRGGALIIEQKADGASRWNTYTWPARGHGQGSPHGLDKNADDAGGQRGSAEQDIVRLCEAAPAIDRAPLRALTQALLRVDPGFVMDRYRAVAHADSQRPDSQRAAALYRALRVDGLWHHEPIVLGWWADMAGAEGDDRAAFMAVVQSGANVTARARLRVFLAGEVAFSEACRIVQAIARLAGAQGTPGDVADVQAASSDAVGTDTQLLLAAPAPDAGGVDSLASAMRILDYWEVGLRGFLEAFMRLKRSERDTYAAEIARINTRMDSTVDYAGSLVSGFFIGHDVTDRGQDAEKRDTLELWKVHAEQALDGKSAVHTLFPTWIAGLHAARRVAEQGRGELDQLTDTQQDDAGGDVDAAQRHATAAAGHFSAVKGFIEGNRAEFGRRIGQVGGFLETIADNEASTAALHAKADESAWVALLVSAGGAFADFNQKLLSAVAEVDWLAVLEVAAEIAGTIVTGGGMLVVKVVAWLARLGQHGAPMFAAVGALGDLFSTVADGALAGLRNLFTLDGFIGTAAGLFFGADMLSRLPRMPETGAKAESAASAGNLGRQGAGLSRLIGVIVGGVRKLMAGYTGVVDWLGAQAGKLDLTGFPWFRRLAGVVNHALGMGRAIAAPGDAVDGLKQSVGGFFSGITDTLGGVLDPVREVLGAIANPAKLFQSLIRSGMSWVMGLLILKPPSAILGAALEIFQSAALGGRNIVDAILGWTVAGQPVGQIIAEKIEGVLVQLPLFAQIQAFAGWIGALIDEVVNRIAGGVAALQAGVMDRIGDAEGLLVDFFGIQRASTAIAGPAPVTAGAVDAMSSSPGERFDGPARADMEDRFGRDFSGVRIHTDRHADSAARGLHAKAMTRGADIYFRAGHYRPESTAGRTLIAHELSHVVQQGHAGPIGGGGGTASGGGPTQAKAMTSSPGDAAEVQAERVAERVVAGVPGAAAELDGGAAPDVVRRSPVDDFGLEFRGRTVEFGAAVEGWQDLMDETGKDVAKGKANCRKFVNRFLSGDHTRAFIEPFTREPDLLVQQFRRALGVALDGGLFAAHQSKPEFDTLNRHLTINQQLKVRMLKAKAVDREVGPVQRLELDCDQWLSTLYVYAASSLMIWLRQAGSAETVRRVIDEGDFWKALRVIGDAVAECRAVSTHRVFTSGDASWFGASDDKTVVLEVPLGKEPPDASGAATEALGYTLTSGLNAEMLAVGDAVSAGALKPPAERYDNAYIATVPTTASGRSPASIADQYATEGFTGGHDEAARRFALVAGINGYDDLAGKNRLAVGQAMRGVPSGWGADRHPLTAVGFLWQPRWIDPDSRSEAEPAEVKAAFARLDSAQRDAVVAYERQMTIGRRNIPYGAIRDFIKDHPQVARYRTALRDVAPSVYVHFGDPDAVSLRAGAPIDVGAEALAPAVSALFARYDTIVAQAREANAGHPPVVVSGGYTFRWAAGGGATRDRLRILANQLDMMVRAAMARLDPSAVYLPEPNLLVRASDDGKVIEASMGVGRNESAQLLEDMRQKQALTHDQIIFDPRADIETDSARFIAITDQRSKEQIEVRTHWMSGEFVLEADELKAIFLTEQQSARQGPWTGRMTDAIRGRVAAALGDEAGWEDAWEADKGVGDQVATWLGRIYRMATPFGRLQEVNYDPGKMRDALVELARPDRKRTNKLNAALGKLRSAIDTLPGAERTALAQEIADYAERMASEMGAAGHRFLETLLNPNP